MPGRSIFLGGREARVSTSIHELDETRENVFVDILAGHAAFQGFLHLAVD